MFANSIRSAVVVVALGLVAGTRARAADQAATPGDVLWVAEEAGVLKVAEADGRVLFELSDLTGVQAVAMDVQRRVLWVYEDSRGQRIDGINILRAFDEGGTQVRSVAGPLSPRFDKATGGRRARLAVNPADGAVLLTAGAQVIAVDGDGWSRWTETLESEARAIVIDPERQVAWIGTEQELRSYELRSGTHQDTIALDPGGVVNGIRGVRDLAATAAGDLWILLGERLLKLDVAGKVVVDRSLVGGLHVVSDGARGAWVATATELLRIGPGGRVLGKTEPFLGVGRIVDLQLHPRERAVWVANEVDLAKVTRGGELLHTWRFQPPVRLLALALDTPARPDGDRGRRATSDPMRVSFAALGANETTIQGTVLQPDGAPAVGASVVVLGQSGATATTGAGGAFTITPVATVPGQSLTVTARQGLPAGAAFASVTAAPVAGGITNVGTLPLAFVCGPSFASGLFPSGALNGDVRALTVFDSGTGPALYVAGTFTTAGGVTVNRVAKWNGTTWSALGSGLSGGTTPSVDALAVWNDGSGARLYAAGKFTNSGAAAVNYVAKWTGTSWTQVGAGLGSQVYALGVFGSGNGSLYAAGSFTTVGSTNFNRIARWSGTSWVTVGTGLNGTAKALAVFTEGASSALHVAGLFTTAGGATANRVAKWSGTVWSAVGTGLAGGTTPEVNALAVFDDGTGPGLYAGGKFTTAGGAAAQSVARWKSGAWSALGAGVASTVYALEAFDDGTGAALYLGGSFTSAGGATANRLARWKGGAWSALNPGTNGVNGTVYALRSWSVAGAAALYPGGAFGTAGGVTSTRLARWQRPPSCTDTFPPTLLFIAPSNGSTVSTMTPSLVLGYSDANSGIEPTTLSVQVNGAWLSIACTFAAADAQCVPQVPLPGGPVTLTATVLDQAGNVSNTATTSFTISDPTPPSIQITAPAAGETVATARPVVRLTYSDVGSGIDTSTLALTFGGLPAAVECQVLTEAAVCVPTADLAAGAQTMGATIRDLQGNVSPQATRGFTVAAVTPRTTFVGRVELEGGAPAAGAKVWIEGAPLAWSTVEADGTFAFADVDVVAALPVRLSAQHGAGNPKHVGFSGPVMPVLGGTTDVGTITLKPDCDAFFETLPWRPIEANLEWGPNAGVVFDDGSGPALYIAGKFNYGSSGTIGRIAKWTPAGWRDVGGGVGYGIQPEVHSLVVFDDGTGPALYAGGLFTTAGGAPANYIAKWDGERWSEVGGGVNGVVTALTVHDDGSGPALYASGEFTRVRTRVPWWGTDESAPANHIAKWNGTTWSQVAGGRDDGYLGDSWRVVSLQHEGGRSLFAWIAFEIWRLDGSSWTSIPIDGESYVSELASFDGGAGPRLVAITGFGVQMRNGGAWTTLLASSMVTSLAVRDLSPADQMWVAGDFSSLSGGDYGTRFWNGSTWSGDTGDDDPLLAVSGLPDGPVLMMSYDADFFTPGVEMRKWNGSIWEAWTATGDSKGSIGSLAAASTAQDDLVFFAGPERAGGVVLNGAVGQWDGSSVSAAATSLTGGDKVIQAWDGARKRLYALATANGDIAEWTGAGWARLGAPVGTTTYTVGWADLGSGMQLYAAGTGVYRWNGGFWVGLGGPSGVRALASFQSKLYVGGWFTSVGAVPAQRVASWDGSTWATLGTGSLRGVDGTVFDLEVFNGSLHIAGDFTRAGTATTARYGYVAWDGFSYHSGVGSNCGYLANRFLSGTIPTSLSAEPIYSLGVFDNGSSSTLVVGGDYAAACTSSNPATGTVLGYRNVNLATGVDGPPVGALAAGTYAGAPAMYVGGSFGAAGGEDSAKLAVWHRSPNWEQCTPASQPPVITITSPSNGLTRESSVTIAGHLDEAATLKLDGVALALAPDLTFSFSSGALREGPNSFLLVARDRTNRETERVVSIVRDSVPPQITVASPVAGSRVLTATPAIDFTMDDLGSGIDPASLVVNVSSSPLPPAACIVGSGRARCVVPSALPSGPVAISATVADHAGNVSPVASSSIVVDLSSGSTSTQVTGSARFMDGIAAAGARVRILGRAGATAVVGADGSYSIALSGLTDDQSLSVVADAERAGQRLYGVRGGIVPVAGGTTIVPEITLKPECDADIVAEFGGPVGVVGRALALAVLDDGSGPVLFVGGTDVMARDEVGPNHLAKWTGSAWVALPVRLDNEVRALAVFDDGRGPALYAGGSFGNAGALLARGLARWNGASWEEVGGGLTSEFLPSGGGPCTSVAGFAQALKIFDDGSGIALYVAGTFTRAGAVASDLVARWNGQIWSSMGARPACGLTRSALALEVYDDGTGPALHVAGAFGSLAAVTGLSNVAKRQGTTWVGLDGGIGRATPTLASAMVTSLAVYDDGGGAELHAAGLFNRAGRTNETIANVARWNGSRWAGVGDGLNAVYTTLAAPTGVQALGVWNDGTATRLYAAGKFLTSGARTIEGIAQWNGSRWDPLAGGIGETWEGGMALGSYQGHLIVAGGFRTAGQLGVNGLADWDGERWTSFGRGLDAAVEALTIYDDGTGPALVAGGRFLSADGVVLNHLGKWTGSRWAPIGGGTDGTVYALEPGVEAGNPVLFAGGDFDNAGGNAATSIAKWNGVGWSALGSGLYVAAPPATTGIVSALEVVNESGTDVLYAGGLFSWSGALSVKNIARWSGSAWSALGAGRNGAVHALLHTAVGAGPARLYAGGDVATGFSGVAAWDGLAWSALGTGIPTGGTVRGLAAWPPGAGASLVATGTFSSAGGVTVSRIARWNGTAWSAFGTGVTFPGEAVAPWDDLSGQTLAAGGHLLLRGWRGSMWFPLSADDTGGKDVLALRSLETGDSVTLYAGGDFSRLDGVAVGNIAAVRRGAVCTDTNPPTIAFTAPASGAFVPGRPQLALSFGDAYSGPDPSTLALTANGAAIVASCTATANSAECVPDAPLTNGTAVVGATIKDLAGNLSLPATLSIQVDTQSPSVAFSEPAEGAILATATSPVRFGYSDAGSGVDRNTVVFHVSGVSTPDFSCSLGVSQAVCTPQTPFEEGLYQATVSLTDVTGNPGSAAPRSFTVDLSPPTLEIRKPIGGSVVSTLRPKIECAYSDAGAGVDATSLSLEANGSPLPVTCSRLPGYALCTPDADLPNGAVTVSAIIRDLAGRISAPATSAITVDTSAPAETTPPVVSFLEPAPLALFDPATTPFRLLVGDRGLGIDLPSLQLDANGTALSVVCQLCGVVATCTPSVPPAGALVTLRATVRDLAGNLSPVAEVQFTTDPGADFTPPQITLIAPLPNESTSDSQVRFIGSLSEPATLTLNGAPVAVDTSQRFHHGPVPLIEGENNFQLVATDPAGNVGQVARTVSRDSVRPLPLDASRVTIGPASGGQVVVTGAAGCVTVTETGLTVAVRSLLTSAVTSSAVAPDGSFVAQLPALGGDRLSAVVVDAVGNRSEPRIFTVVGQPAVPPAPETIAPALDPTTATDFFRATEFLHTGANPIQSGVAAGTIEPRRAAVLRGSVVDEAGAPLPGAVVSVVHRPELGMTVSRADGLFDLVVNGGGKLVVRVAREGRLSADRTVEVPWREFVAVPEVALIAQDSNVTPIDLGAALPVQVAQGPVVTDASGSRQAAILFAQGTQATAEFEGGATQQLTNLGVRVTEYTVGPGGPAAMPASLPPTSFYTYAAEFTIDQASAAGASTVRFSQPVPIYLENFLSLPVGTIVPAAYYDREQTRWVASQDGRVLKVLAFTGGLADLDLEGDGQPAISSALAALGITTTERQALAARYAIGQSLWRVRVTHFSAWDFNLPGEGAANPQPPKTDGPKSDDTTQCPSKADGSIIECDNQILGEVVAVSGTPFTLNYRSGRVPGRKVAYQLRVPVSDPAQPASVKRVDVDLSIAGQQIQQSFATGSTTPFVFNWDGRDGYGRTVQGTQEYESRVGYVYDAVYSESPATCAPCFAIPGSGPISGNPARQEVTFWQTHRGRIGIFDSLQQAGLGGWTLSAHHVYDPHSQMLYLGSGDWRKATDAQIVTARVVGTGAFGTTGDGGPATAATLARPRGVAPTPDGGYYVVDVLACKVRKVSANGIITRVAGTDCSDGPLGDGGPATAARLRHPATVDLAPDGSLYIVDQGNHLVRRVDPQGIITTFAGRRWHLTGEPPPQTAAQAMEFYFGPFGAKVGPDGAVYVTEDWVFKGVVLRIAPDGGSWSVYAGNGSYPGGEVFDEALYNSLGDGGRATDAWFNLIHDLTFDTDGNLYFATDDTPHVWQVDTAGFIHNIAGTWDVGETGPGAYRGYTGDGGQGRLAKLDTPTHVVVARDGSVLFSDLGNNVVRRVDNKGTITTVVGTGAPGYNGNDRPARQTQLSGPAGLGILEDGRLLVADFGNNMVRAIEDVFPPSEGQAILIPAGDGRSRYVFDATGRHLRTEDTQTGQALLTFSYNPAGLLVSIQDVFGNTTTVERDGAGHAQAIVGPFGQRTELEAQGQDGYLSAVENPAGERIEFEYGQDGLLEGMTDAKGGAWEYTYDALGRLLKDEDPLGGFTALARSETGNSWTVTQSSAMGRATTHTTERLATAGERTTVTQPDGTVSIGIRKPDGSRTSSAADGTVSTTIQGPEPRYGMQQPIVQSVTVSTPGGLTSTTTTNRVVTFVNPNGDSKDPSNLAGITDTATINDRTVTSVYNKALRRMTTTSPEGRQGTTDFDALGRIVQVQTPGVLPRTNAYDARGRLQSVTQGNRTTNTTYNAQGYVESVTDALEREVRYTYDLAGRVKTQTLPDLRVIQFDYDLNGNLTSLTPPGRPAHAFDHTAVNLAREYTPPDLGATPEATTFDYNLDRQLELVTRPDGQTIDYAYGASTGRLDSVTAPHGTYSYTYNTTVGTLSSVTDPDGNALAYTYDGSLPTSVTLSGEVSGAVGYVHGNDFRLTTRTVNGGNAINFAYDDDNLVTQAGDLVLNRAPATGFLVGTSVGQSADSYTYSNFAELDTYTATFAANTLYSTEFVRDAGGRISRKAETIGGVTDNYDYRYDSAGRLDQVKKNDAVVATYGYDANSNRISWTDPWGSGTATYDNQDRLLTSVGRSYTYTLNGELLTKTAGPETTTFSYDAFGNLRSVSLPTGIQIEYVIDPANRRVGRKVDGTLVQRFLYDGQLSPAAEVDSSGAVTALFIYATKGNVPDYLVKSGIKYRVVTDHLGSVRLVVNVVNGAIAQRLDYDSFGRVVLDTSPGFQPFAFAGGLYDYQTGLVRFGVRDYDAETGRWTSKDPIGFGGGDSNLYGYALVDPLNAIDPSGLFGLADLPNVPDGVGDFFAGIGDTLLFSLGDELREMLGIQGVNLCSDAYSAGEWAGVALGTVLGGAQGLRAAGAKAPGLNFSHWIPDRVLKRTGSRWVRNSFGRSAFNGNYVTLPRHFGHDPHRYIPGWRELTRLPPLLQQIDRVPRLYYGAAAGASLAGTAAAID